MYGKKGGVALPTREYDVFYEPASCIVVYSFVKNKDLNVDLEMSINEGLVLRPKNFLGNVVERTIVIHCYARTRTLKRERMGTRHYLRKKKHPRVNQTPKKTYVDKITNRNSSPSRLTASYSDSARICP